MSPTTLATLAVVLAYLIGAIPFAFVVVRAVKGIDVRTVGSGNVGATNAGRLLGIKFFFLVFLLDLLKGLLPTLLLPLLVRRMGGVEVANLRVMIALAAILGHNYPIYLNFRGGKGVATSLGALLGLDWIASLAAAGSFLVSLTINKYVSLSSLAGAFAFVLTHFAIVIGYERKSPWDGDHLAMSLLTLALLGMMVVKHRKNWARIRQGTEPKISRRKTPPSGKAALVVVVAIVAMIGFGVLLWMRIARAATLDCGTFTLREVARVQTGHQRADRVAFADRGTRLAVTCPRYDRLVIYSIPDAPSLNLAHDVALGGQPAAVVAGRDRFFVLLRPSGDDRHIHEGWIQAIGFDGHPIGPKALVGFYPTDLAVSSSGKIGFALTSGRAEGDSPMPPPALVSVDLATGRQLGRVTFNSPGDAPSRIALSSSGLSAVVSVRGTNQAVAIDLADFSGPRIIGRSPLPLMEVPYPSISDEEWVLMPVASDRESVVLANPGMPSNPSPLGGFLVSTLPEDSALEVRTVETSSTLGRLALRGSSSLSEIRPMGLACSPERGLIAVANRSGGVHLVGLRANRARRARNRG